MSNVSPKRVDVPDSSCGSNQGKRTIPVPHLRLIMGEGGTVQRVNRSNPHTAGRRLFDIAFALAVLLITCPLMVAVTLLVRATSEGPAFLRQRRLTLHGREFWLYKFRTMYVNAETFSGPVLAEENDPRITPVGRFLRKTRIDELPQLINVLLGDMSVIGPRPERPEIAVQLARSLRRFNQRLYVNAGLTGLAQIENGYVSSVESYRRKLALDILYIKRRTPILDMIILLRTVTVVLLGKGAR